MTARSLARSLLATLLIALFGTARAQACTIPPETAYAPAQVLVKRTATVIVGDVRSVSIEGNIRHYRVKVIERLKGSAPEWIDVRLPMHGAGTAVDVIARLDTPIDAAYHATGSFWLGGTAAGAISPMCAVIFGPQRGLHVIFLGEPFHLRGFEPISDLKDTWYLTVKRMVADPALTGRVVTPDEFVRLFFTVYRITCKTPDQDGVQCSEPSLWWGTPIDFRALNPALRTDPSICAGAGGPDCVVIWSFFLTADGRFAATRWGNPFAVPVVDGKLAFERQCGDLVLTRTSIDENDLMAALLRARIAR
jgi:hypothetical protein